MQASNGSHKPQAGQKRSTSRRDKIQSAGGAVATLPSVPSKEGGYDSSGSETSSESSCTSSASSSSVSSSTSSSLSVSERGGKKAADLDNVFEDDDFGK